MIAARTIPQGLLLAALLGAGGSGTAATPADLDAAAARITAAAQALAEAEAAQDRVAPLASAISAYDAALADLRDVAIGAGAGERQVALDLNERRAEVMRLAAALQTMSRTPPPAQAMHPDGPLAAARASVVMARMTPALQKQAEALATELRSLDVARQLRRQAFDDLASGLERLAAARSALSASIAAKAPAEEDAVAAAVQASLLRDSASLSALADALTDAPAGKAIAPLAPGSLLWPVKGRTRLGFREPDAAGERRPGLLLQADPLSLVSAPAAAMVRYAGPFLEYGYVTVLETDDGTVLVLAGLAQLNVAVGQPVHRGDLLGLLGGRNLDAEEYVMLPAPEAGAGASETLYIEVRRGRGPVDPAPWFDDGNG